MWSDIPLSQEWLGQTTLVVLQNVMYTALHWFPSLATPTMRLVTSEKWYIHLLLFDWAEARDVNVLAVAREEMGLWNVEYVAQAQWGSRD